jgi:hypothetical protein
VRRDIAAAVLKPIHRPRLCVCASHCQVYRAQGCTGCRVSRAQVELKRPTASDSRAAPQGALTPAAPRSRARRLCASPAIGLSGYRPGPF